MPAWLPAFGGRIPLAEDSAFCRAVDAAAIIGLLQAHGDQRSALTMLAARSIVKAHSQLIGLSVEFALNRSIGRPLIEPMRRIEQILHIEIPSPVPGNCVRRAEIHGRAGSIPNVPGFLAADRE